MSLSPTLTLQDYLTLKNILSTKILEQEMRIAYYLEEPKTALLSQIEENKRILVRLNYAIQDKSKESRSIL